MSAWVIGGAAVLLWCLLSFPLAVLVGRFLRQGERGTQPLWQRGPLRIPAPRSPALRVVRPAEEDPPAASRARAGARRAAGTGGLVAGMTIVTVSAAAAVGSMQLSPSSTLSRVLEIVVPAGDGELEVRGRDPLVAVPPPAAPTGAAPAGQAAVPAPGRSDVVSPPSGIMTTPPSGPLTAAAPAAVESPDEMTSAASPARSVASPARPATSGGAPAAPPVAAAVPADPEPQQPAGQPEPEQPAAQPVDPPAPGEDPAAAASPPAGEEPVVEPSPDASPHPAADADPTETPGAPAPGTPPPAQPTPDEVLPDDTEPPDDTEQGEAAAGDTTSTATASPTATDRSGRPGATAADRASASRGRPAAKAPLPPPLQ